MPSQVHMAMGVGRHRAVGGRACSASASTTYQAIRQALVAVGLLTPGRQLTRRAVAVQSRFDPPRGRWNVPAGANRPRPVLPNGRLAVRRSPRAVHSSGGDRRLSASGGGEPAARGEQRRAHSAGQTVAALGRRRRSNRVGQRLLVGPAAWRAPGGAGEAVEIFVATTTVGASSPVSQPRAARSFSSPGCRASTQQDGPPSVLREADTPSLSGASSRPPARAAPWRK